MVDAAPSGQAAKKAKAKKATAKAKAAKQEPGAKGALQQKPKRGQAKAGEQPELEPKKKKMKRTAAGHLLLTVGLTGARAGDTLEGCAEDSQGVVLRIATGIVHAPGKILRQVPREEVVTSIAKHFGISRAIAELRYNDIPQQDTTADGHARPNHLPLGGNCQHAGHLALQEACTVCSSEEGTCQPEATFVLLQPGKFQQFADDAGQGATLNRYVAEQTELCFRDLLCIVGKKQLILRPVLFQVVSGPKLMEDPGSITGHIMDASSLDRKSEHRHYQFDEQGMGSVVIKLPAPGSPLERADVIAAVCEALGLEGAEERAHVEAAYNLLSRMSSGGLKSSMQKTIRFHSSVVQLLPGVPAKAGSAGATAAKEITKVPSRVYAATALALLFADKGSFSPELQLYTRGCTSALKRLAIILVEDTWLQVPKIERALRSLLGLALACQRITTYYPSRKSVLKAIALAALAADSPHVLLCWWPHVPDEHNRNLGDAPGTRDDRTGVSKESAEALRDAAKLLRVIRSFDSDMRLMEKVAKEGSTGTMRVFKADPRVRPKKMQAWHACDQHYLRGIGHLLGPNVAPSFAERFKKVFWWVTGTNSRLQKLNRFDEKAQLIREVRFAQKCMLRFAVGLPLRQLPSAAGSFNAQLPLDSGTFSAAIGPVRVKTSKAKKAGRNVLVIIGVDVPEDEITMLPPSRNMKDLYDGVTPEERADAVAVARGMKLPVRSPLIPNGVATFKGATMEWCLDGRPWSKYVEEGIRLDTPLHPAPEWSTQHVLDTTLLDNDAVIKTCLLETGAGVCTNAEQIMRELLPTLPQPVVLRARSLLRQQYAVVAMPTPSLSGGLGSDQLMAYPEDWTVYRLLLVVARLVPGALEPRQAPTFRVKNAALLRLVEQWFLAAAKQGGGAKAVGAGAVGGSKVAAAKGGSAAITFRGGGGGGATAASAPASASGAGTGNAWADDARWVAAGGLCDQQLMEHQRDAVSRMLERDDRRGVPGHFLVMDTGLGKTITAICYLHKRLSTTPLGQQVKYILWVTPRHTVPGLVAQLKKERKCPVNLIDKVGTKLRAQHINVVHSDLLRKLILKDLPSKAPSCAVVFDEVDTMYEATQRTSACRRVAQLCPVFVAQTATPMVKNVEHLVAWLQNTEQYPVDKKNFLVGASGMVSTQISLGIKAVDELIKVPLVDTIREAHRRYRQDRDWLALARATQHATDLAMCKHAAALASADRKAHPKGGVLLVANDGKHADRLVALMAAASFPAKLGSRVGTFEDISNGAVGCVVVPKSKDRGYNSGSRLGAMVKGAYAGNGSSRHQMRGRIRRLGQKRKEVTYATVVMEHSMLELLDERQKGVDSINISLEALAKKFDAVVLGLLDK